ncbi:MAG TPA: iron ABC transporter permease [Polyangiaceae bacterium]|nr:iron ABC transporter permease [Polyangiaceae bacterium]
MTDAGWVDARGAGSVEPARSVALAASLARGLSGERRRRLVLVGLGVAVLGCAAANLALGAMHVPLARVLAALLEPFGVPVPALGVEERAVVLAIRLPRVLLGLSVGAALGVSGALMQGLFRNPLADPTLIGVSSGAALGAKTVIVLGTQLGASLAGDWALPLCAFLGALAVTWLVWGLSRRDGRTDVTTLLLAGIAINALAMALQGLLALIASDAQLRTLTFWMLGSLGGATFQSVGLSAPGVALVIVAAPFFAGSLNALLLGEGDARCLGVDVERLKRVAIVLTAVAVGSAVAFCGNIAFVGLLAPHLLRLAFGPDHRLLLPGAALLGAVLISLSDLVSRTLLAPQEIPLGILTATLGAPFFLWLLRRRRLIGGL